MKAKTITRISYKVPPEKGDRGERGALTRVRYYAKGVEWLSGAPGEAFVDYAYYNGLYYRCNESHTSRNDETPYDEIGHGYTTWVLESNFQFIATGVAFIGEGAEGWIIDEGRIYHTSGLIELSADGTIKTSNGKFSLDKNGNLIATSGTFSGFLKIPFKSFAEGATYRGNGIYRVSNNFNLFSDGVSSGYEMTLELPSDVSYSGTLLTVFDPPIKTKSSTLLTIKSVTSYRILHPNKKGTYGLDGCTQIVCTRGGLIQLLAVSLWN